MDFSKILEKRHSVRAYKPDDVEEEKLSRILEAARLAPTAANYQPFKVFVIRTEKHAEALLRIYNRKWFVEAPYILCVCAIRDKGWVRRDGKSFSDVDAAIIMDHMILAATELDLGTCWIGAFDAVEAAKFLEAGDALEPIAFTPLGYERETGFNRVRKPLGELVVYK